MVGNILLLILNIPLIGIWVRMLNIPYHYLYPAILMFVAIGVYSVNNNVFDIYAVAVVGVIGYLLSTARFEFAPLILGFILGPMMEEYFRRALLLSRGDLMTFVERPISAAILAITMLIIVFSIAKMLRARN